MTLDDMPPGTMCVISTDGQFRFLPRSVDIGAVCKLLGCTTLDGVNIGRARGDDLVMLVDDNGYETRVIDHGDGRIELLPTKALKPVNPVATALYHTLTGPGNPHQIVGDVAIVHDRDFE